MLFCISVVVALLMAVILFRLFFSGFPDFVEAFCRPNVCTVKLVIWVALAIVAGVGTYYVLPGHVPKLARNRAPNEANSTAAETRPTAIQARTGSRSGTNSASNQPPEAASRGVKLGDNVQISAIHPPIALNSAVITSMNDTQLTVRASGGSYTILWKDLTGLKPVTLSTNKAGSK